MWYNARKLCFAVESLTDPNCVTPRVKGAFVTLTVTLSLVDTKPDAGGAKQSGLYRSFACCSERG